MSPRNATEIGKRRTYEYRGVKYPSVTTLLKGYPQEWAIAYGAKATAERVLFNLEAIRRRLDDGEPMDSVMKWAKLAPHEKRDAAGESGTNLHRYLEYRMLGRSIEDWGVHTPSEIAIEQFLSTYRPDPIYVESQVVSVAEGYAGSFDAIVDIYGRRYLLDLKTATTYDPLAERPSDAGGDHKDRLQLAAYRYADIIFEDDRDIGPVPQVDGCLILAIPRDHPSAWRPIEVQAGPAEYRAFLRFRDAWVWYEANKKQAIGEHLLAQAEGSAA